MDDESTYVGSSVGLAVGAEVGGGEVERLAMPSVLVAELADHAAQNVALAYDE